MMNLAAYDTIEGVTVYNDNESDVTFYVLPNVPTYRLDENGKAVFHFTKYREPTERSDGTLGGGLAMFDTALVLPEATQAKIREELQARVSAKYAARNQQAPQVRLAQITWTSGTASLIISSPEAGFVEKVTNPASPSLYGQMITPFTVELSQKGATLFEEIMQGGGGAVQVSYDLTTIAALPPIKVWGYFFAEKFYSFYQTITKDDGDWWSDSSYNISQSEQSIDSSFYTLKFDWGALTDTKAQQAIRDWAQRTMEDQIKNKMIANIDPQGDRDAVDGFDNTTRAIAVSKIASFSFHYEETDPIEIHRLPGGTLVNITNLKDKDGKPFAWSDYSDIVNLNDPFFQQIRAVAQVNAPFDELPIYSVDLHFQYPGADPQDYIIKSADDLAKFNAYVEDENRKYKYSYVVNYKNETRTLSQIDVETDREAVTINVGDMGFLGVKVKTGAIDFENQVSSIIVTMQYDDQAHGVELVRDQFTLDKDNQDCRFEKLIFEPVRNPYTYEVTYRMLDRREYHIPPTPEQTKNLFIRSPFHGMKTVGIRARGLDTLVDEIFVDLTYIDEENNYTQKTSISLNQKNKFFDWIFPVISERAGTVTYTQSISYKDHSTEDIPEMTVPDNDLTFFVGPEPIKVNVLPDLLDWTTLRLVTVSLKLTDETNGNDETHDVIFRPTPPPSTVTYEFASRDDSEKSLTWQATYYMTDRTTKKSPPEIITLKKNPGEITVLPDGVTFE